jgi:DNA-binding NarL/FixJ family response regulator
MAVDAAQGRAPVRVVLADDEPLMLAGLRTVLETGGAVRVVGQAGDGAELLVAVDAHRPDVVLADVQMPGTDGLSALRVLRVLRARPDAPPAAILTTFDHDDGGPPSRSTSRRCSPSSRRRTGCRQR